MISGVLHTHSNLLTLGWEGQRRSAGPRGGRCVQPRAADGSQLPVRDLQHGTCAPAWPGCLPGKAQPSWPLGPARPFPGLPGSPCLPGEESACYLRATSSMLPAVGREGQQGHHPSPTLATHIPHTRAEFMDTRAPLGTSSFHTICTHVHSHTDGHHLPGLSSVGGPQLCSPSGGHGLREGWVGLSTEPPTAWEDSVSCGLPCPSCGSVATCPGPRGHLPGHLVTPYPGHTCSSRLCTQRSHCASFEEDTAKNPRV